MKHLDKETVKSINFINVFLWIVNATIFGYGTYIILGTYTNLDKENGIQNCENVYLLTGLMVINSLIVIIGFFKYILLSVLSLTSSSILAGYNILNLYRISKECKNDYNNNHYNFWVFYNVCISIQVFNMLTYILKAVLYECGQSGNPKDLDENTNLINKNVTICNSCQRNTCDICNGNNLNRHRGVSNLNRKYNSRNTRIRHPLYPNLDNLQYNGGNHVVPPENLYADVDSYDEEYNMLN